MPFNHQLLLCPTDFVSSSHTHSGGGAYLDLPILGEALAGPFNSNIQQLYINGVVEATIKAYENKQPAKIGIGRSILKDRKNNGV